jgi:IS5 family transposase
VVESNIHYPTDSSLIRDGVRVITRNLKRIAEACTEGALKVVDHRRTVKNRLIEIERASKSFTESSRTKFKDSYGKLMGITRGVVRQAETVMQALQAGTLPIMGSVLSVSRSQYELQHFLPLVKKVLAQTRARVFEGERHYPDKLVSIFEEHTAVIRKGKVSKPTEFGRLVRIDEVENGIVSHYDVTDGNPADQPQWVPALKKHMEQFGQPPGMATADRGFFSADNEQQAKKLGVEKVALPARGRLAKKRAKLQQQRWFRRALKWRGGIESRIATLKHRFAMFRATYKGDRGFKRYVGWSVISQNLISIARTKRKKEKDKQNARKNRTVE